MIIDDVYDMIDGIVEGVKRATAAGNLNSRLDEDGEGLSDEERAALRDEFMTLRPLYGKPSPKYSACRGAARAFAALSTELINLGTPVEGIENIYGIEGGAIVTTNHFSPTDSTMFRKVAKRTGRNHVAIAIGDENLAMGGLFGFLIKYTDAIPLAMEHRYVLDYFEPMLERELASGNFVIIYPEQEMWFNYRKPRPCKRGAYMYATRYGVPVIPCFVEVRGKEGISRPNYIEVSYALHILDPIYPDPNLSERENSIEMAERDYEQKVEAYEKAFGQKLDYRFELGDVAGWVPRKEAGSQRCTGKAVRSKVSQTSAERGAG